jgi:ABC-type sugar transport system, periplasmic component
MATKTTMQDIAKVANVTVGTVYKALNNQKGVSEEKKLAILSIAREMHYIPSLVQQKNTEHQVAVLFPKPEGADKYFYQYIWKGIEARTAELAPLRFKILEFTFDGTPTDQQAKLHEIYDGFREKIDALITIIWDENAFLDILGKYNDAGIEIFTISSDAPFSQRKATIMSNPYKTGRLAAEYLGSVIPDNGRVIIMGTKRDSSNHAQVVRGFFDQMNITNPDIQIIELYETKNHPERIAQTVKDFLRTFDDVRGIYINNARTTEQLCKSMIHYPHDVKLKIVGSELFPESIQYLKSGLLCALIDQKPYDQGYKGISMAFDSIALNQQVNPVCYITNALCLQNNIPSEKN